MKQILDGRSNPLKKTENNILQLNVTNRVLTDNKERDSEFKGIDCTVKTIIYWKMLVLTILLTTGSLEGGKMPYIPRLCQVQKIFVANTLSIVNRLERVLR